MIRSWLGWLGGGFLAALLLCLGWLYLRGVFRTEVQYQVSNAPGLDDPRFPLLVVGLSNALATRGELTSFWEGTDAIYAARLDAIRRAQQVLTMGENNDKPIVRYASRELYGELLEAGVEICEYQPSMMHAKLALIDDQWVSTGSANFDPRSYHHNDELNISTSNAQLIREVDRFFTDALERSHCLNYQTWRDRPFHERIMGQIGLIAKPLL